MTDEIVQSASDSGKASDVLGTIYMLPDTRPRRVVLEHTRGPYAGLRQIVGTTDDFGGQSPPPTTTEPFNAIPDNRATLAGLISAHRGYVLYREISFGQPARQP